MNPVVSIITPSYNRADLLPRTWDSIKRQTEQNFQWIVVDDGSTDHTATVIRDFDDIRIHYIWQENTGVCGARNRGEQEVRADYVVFLDSDDELCSTTTLKEMLREIKCAGAEVGHVYFTVVDSITGVRISHLEKDRMMISYVDRACARIRKDFIMIAHREALSSTSWPPYNGMEGLRIWRMLKERPALAVNKCGIICHREHNNNLTSPPETIRRARQMAQAATQLIDENQTTWLAHCPCQLGIWNFYRAMYLALSDKAFNTIPSLLFAFRWGTWNVRYRVVRLMFFLLFPRVARQKIYLLWCTLMQARRRCNPDRM